MTGEQGNHGIITNAFEAAQRSLILGRHIGGVAYTKATEIYMGRPAADQPHISERVRATLPVSEAQVAQQFVELGQMLHPEDAKSSEEHKDIKDRRRGYLWYGHQKLIKTLLRADADPVVDAEVVHAVADIAHQVGTNPEKLEGTFSEFEVERAKHILDP